MRVAQVNYAYDGALAAPAELLNRYTTLTGWADALAGAGADVLTVQAFRSSANVTRRGLPYVFGDFSTLARAAAAFRPDIVHVNGLGFAWPAWRLGRRARSAAIVFQDHAGGVPRGLRRATLRAFMLAADAFLFTAAEQAEPWRRAGLIGAAQAVYEVMESSTDMRSMPRAAARAASGVAGEPAVLWVGRLNANKDPLTVLEAFERFAGWHPGARLTMVYHGGDQIGAVRARVVGSPMLRERVRLAGEVAHERMATFYSAADVFVLGSHHEGSGYALIEALACGAMPAVTEIPSFRAICGAREVPGTCLAPPWHRWTPGDAAGCARALGAAAALQRQRALDHFEANLTWDAVGKRAMQIYEEVVRNRAGDSGLTAAEG